VTVLHSQKLASTGSADAVYAYPSGRAGTVNEPPLHVDCMYAAIKHGSWLRVLYVHSHDARQPAGAEIPATAKPGKKKKDVSSIAKSDI